MNLQEIIFEVTRKCNLECAHCLRGEPQDIDLPNLVVDGILNNVERIERLVFSGGEPLLNVDSILYILEGIISREIEVSCFYISINGTIYNQKLVDGMNHFYNNCVTEKESCYVSISKDIFHRRSLQFNNSKIIERYIKEFDFLAYETRDIEVGDMTMLIPEGRGRKLQCAMNYSPDCEYSGILYVTALGDITINCNLSYESQEFYKVGNYTNFKDIVNRFEGG